MPIAPHTGSIAPYTGSIAPYTVPIAPHTGSIAPHTGSIAPYTVPIAPHTGSIAPYTVSIAPYTVPIAPHTGPISPHTGSIAPYTVSIAPYTVPIAPHTGPISPYTGSIAPYTQCPLLPTQGPLLLLPEQGNPLKFTLFQNIHSWICAAQHLHARTSVTSYTSVNIYNFNSRLAHFNALWMEYICSLRTGIMEEYPVMSTNLRSNRTNIWSDKSNTRHMQSGGARGLELTTAEVDHLIIEGMENLEVKQGILGNLRNFIFLWKPIFFSILWWIELKRTAFIWNKKTLVTF